MTFFVSYIHSSKLLSFVQAIQACLHFSIVDYCIPAHHVHFLSSCFSVYQLTQPALTSICLLNTIKPILYTLYHPECYHPVYCIHPIPAPMHSSILYAVYHLTQPVYTLPCNIPRLYTVMSTVWPGR